MFECGHIVLRMMLSPAPGFAPPSLYGNSCQVECLIKGYPLIAGNPLSRTIPCKVNPSYHKHVYLIVSRHMLKPTITPTMQKFENTKNHRENHRPKEPKRSRETLSTNIENTNKHKTQTTWSMSGLGDIGLKVVLLLLLLLFCHSRCFVR